MLAEAEARAERVSRLRAARSEVYRRLGRPGLSAEERRELSRLYDACRTALRELGVR